MGRSLRRYVLRFQQHRRVVSRELEHRRRRQPESEPWWDSGVLRVVFHNPEIPPNTGNAIRLVACTPAELHLIEPLGFNLEDKQLRRAGLDYHDLARVFVHPSLDACLEALNVVDPVAPVAPVDSGAAPTQPRVFAFTRNATTSYADIEYRGDDVLLFGRESDGLPDAVLQDPRVTEQLRLPMLPGRRSMNLANCASIAVYEAWRQLGFAADL